MAGHFRSQVFPHQMLDLLKKYLQQEKDGTLTLLQVAESAFFWGITHQSDIPADVLDDLRLSNGALAVAKKHGIHLGPKMVRALLLEGIKEEMPPEVPPGLHLQETSPKKRGRPRSQRQDPVPPVINPTRQTTEEETLTSETDLEDSSPPLPERIALAARAWSNNLDPSFTWSENPPVEHPAESLLAYLCGYLDESEVYTFIRELTLAHSNLHSEQNTRRSSRTTSRRRSSRQTSAERRLGEVLNDERAPLTAEELQEILSLSESLRQEVRRNSRRRRSVPSPVDTYLSGDEDDLPF